MLYGTAWKEDDTAELVALAMRAGFRGIDTANQRKHYHEAGVGDGLAQALDGGTLTSRDEVWLQTKFTHAAGQDHRLPYTISDPPSKWVVDSVSSSLEHLGVESLDAYVLHGPSQRTGWSEVDVQVWRAMEDLHARGIVRSLGVSNVSASQVEELVGLAQVMPSWVQNRCYAQMAWDLPVREVCEMYDIGYQGFSLLTANPRVVGSGKVKAFAEREQCTPEQVVFALAQRLGMLPLTGTTDPVHMRLDLEIDRVSLTDGEVETLEWMAVPGGRR